MTEMLDTLLGNSVYDLGGDKIGKVKRVYLDNNSGSPTWIAVSTGLFSGDALVPLAGAQHGQHAATLLVQVEKEAVKTAPQLEHDGQISPQAEQELFDHYRMDPNRYGWDGYRGQQGRVDDPRADAEMAAPQGWREPDAEQDSVGTAQMRNYPVTEDAATVPTEVRPVRDPFAVDSSELGDEEGIGPNERPVARHRRSMPVERVRSAGADAEGTRSGLEERTDSARVEDGRG